MRFARYVDDDLLTEADPTGDAVIPKQWQEPVVVATALAQSPTVDGERETGHEHNIDQGRIDGRARRSRDPVVADRHLCVGMERNGNDAFPLDTGQRDNMSVGDEGIQEPGSVRLRADTNEPQHQQLRCSIRIRLDRNSVAEREYRRRDRFGPTLAIDQTGTNSAHLLAQGSFGFDRRGIVHLCTLARSRVGLHLRRDCRLQSASMSDPATDSSEPSFDAARFRQVLGHFPTGVTVITGMAGDIPAGFTIGSFTSVSLDPPLVGFLPQTTSDTWAAIAPSGRFCVNVLGADQAAECWKFAKKGAIDCFDDLVWHVGIGGSPILDDAIAWMECSVEVIYEVGDHFFVVGRVIEMSHAETDPQPLLFYRGKLGGFSLHDS